MAVDPVTLDPDDSELVRSEAARRGERPEQLAHEAIVSYLEVRQRFPFVGTVRGSREELRARDADEILEREGFGRA